MTYDLVGDDLTRLEVLLNNLRSTALFMANQETDREHALLQQLKVELLKCSKDAQAQVASVLHMPAIKHLLASCLTDSSKSLEDWIWDPRCQALLRTVRARADELDLGLLSTRYQEEFAAVQKAKKTFKENAAPSAKDASKGDNILSDEEECLKVKAEAKALLDNGNYYGAMNRYTSAGNKIKAKVIEIEAEIAELEANLMNQQVSGQQNGTANSDQQTELTEEEKDAAWWYEDEPEAAAAEGAAAAAAEERLALR
eukprot:CAMPEP_0194670908 /NCGR_PEP_ID=MMETSP0295-20121207/5493_1 /TAXON_ID=39354 /ORGANISM="Heterosigma akashiwo, Strain CCMP2393" /LENGTH=255 /DNA_ID=CAMNT_0039554243 /DNA_START=45 /DNA_END=807 /DNA_ORIENTATION=+